MRKDAAPEKKAQAAAYARVFRAKHHGEPNPTKSAYNRAYYQANKEHKDALTKEWFASHPGVRSLQARRYEARKRNQFVEDVRISVLMDRDNEVCHLCGEFVRWDQASVDHLIPISKGGEHSYANTKLAHMTCNKRRGAKPLP